MKKILKKIIPKFIFENYKEVKKFIFIRKYKKYSFFCKQKGQKEYIIFGTPLHGNIGDHAIVISEYKLFKDIGINVFEVPSVRRFEIIEYLKNNLNKDAIIIITGGGFMGNQWMLEEKMIRDIVSNFLNNKLIFFPLTAFYKDDNIGKEEFKKSFEIYKSHSNIVMCAREEKTYGFLKKNYKNAKILLMPDIVLYLDFENYNYIRNGILICLRKDPEKKLKTKDLENIQKISKKYVNNVKYTDTVINKNISQKNRFKIFKLKLKEFSKFNVIITDRLHGMIFATLTKTPCIVFGNYNHKVEGVYKWIKDIKYIRFIDDISQLDVTLENLLKYRKIDSINEIKNKFDELKKELK